MRWRSVTGLWEVLISANIYVIAPWKTEASHFCCWSVFAKGRFQIQLCQKLSLAPRGRVEELPIRLPHRLLSGKILPALHRDIDIDRVELDRLDSAPRHLAGPRWALYNSPYLLHNRAHGGDELPYGVRRHVAGELGLAADFSSDGRSSSGDQDVGSPDYKKMYDRVSSLARIGVWECQLPTEVLTWTNTVYDLFGMPRGAPLQRSETVELYEPGSRAELERCRSKAIRDGTGFCLDALIRPQNGGERWIRITADVEQEGGRSARIFGTKQDITIEKLAHGKLQALQNELIHVSRVSAMETMASSLAHELNQPLATAANYMAAARMIAEREGVSAELDRTIADAIASTQHAGEIIRRIRGVVSKKTNLKQKVAIHDIVGKAVLLITSGRDDVWVEWDLAHIPPIELDPIQLQQVIINLIKNACEATQTPPCRVEITGSFDDSELVLCVADTGPGFRSEILPRVFDPFSTTKESGMGVGLSIVRTIVEAHGGRVTARNRPDGGAEVCVTVPRLELK